MKLRNLLFATMVACAFSACSNEDDPINGDVTPEAAEATLSFAVNSGDIATKAVDVTGTTDEKKVVSLSVLVFNDEGKYLTAKTQEFEGAGQVAASYKIDDVKVKATKVQILAVANMDASLFANKTLEECQLDVVARAEASDATGGFIMSSKAFAGTLVAGKEMVNTFGYTAEGDNNTANGEEINLHRIVARIQLDKVSLNFDQSTDLKGAGITLRKIYLSNVRATTKYMSAISGSIEDAESVWVGGVTVSKEDGHDLIVAEGVTEDSKLVWTPARADGDMITVNANGTAEKSLTGVSFYVPENNCEALTYGGKETAHTLLIIEAMLTKKAGASTVSSIVYYTIRVNKEGVADGKGDGTIKRNTVYDITNATFTGSGNDNPDIQLKDSKISVQVKVAPWTVVPQSPEIE